MGHSAPLGSETELGLQIDSMLINRYRVRRELGIGGMGRVYLGEDETLGTVVAIKVLRDLLSRDPGSVQRLKKEAKLAMQLSHPNIVRVHDYQEAEIIKFLVMEYVEGDTLAHRVARETTLPEIEARRITIAICHGLEHAHEKGIIHRDLKPGNILLGKDGSIKIADFGIARVCRDSMSRLTSQLDSGTVTYMSPEQLMGESSERSDVYSLGVILYELLSGEVPFHSGDIQAQIREKYPKPLAGVSAEMNGIILKCLVKLPEGRYAGVRDLRELLEGNRGTSRPAMDHGPAGSETISKPQLDEKRQRPEAVAAPSPPAASPAAGKIPTVSEPGIKRESGGAPMQRVNLVVRSAVRGALGFGIGSVPPAFCAMLYLNGIWRSPFVLLLAFAAFVSWGAIGARMMNLDRRGIRGFAIGFLVLGAIAVPTIANRMDPNALLTLVGLGLLIAAAIASALMRMGKLLVFKAALAFGAFPLFVMWTWPLVFTGLSHEFSFVGAAFLSGAFSGCLFGIALALWRSQAPS
jgi:predicted Ser/Thr protein kinase